MERAGRLIGKLKLSSVLAEPEARARAAWRLAAGDKIARHTRPTMLVRGSLIVEVEDYIWQKQLSTLRSVLIKNMANALGEALVTDLDFRPMPPRRQPQREESPRRLTEGIQDPVMEMLYRQSQKKESA
jgi:predicted nucleic acid-binding Zn ribbon protein